MADVDNRSFLSSSFEAASSDIASGRSSAPGIMDSTFVPLFKPIHIEGACDLSILAAVAPPAPKGHLSAKKRNVSCYFVLYEYLY